MTNELMRAEPTTYPFRFLCEERYSAQAAMELIADLYGDSHEQLQLAAPPALGHLTYSYMHLFMAESFARMVLKGDYNGGEMGSGLQEHIQELFEEQQMPLNEFVDWCLQTFNFVSIDAFYRQGFHHDIQIALRDMGLSFADTDHDVEHYSTYKKMSTFKDMPLLRDIMVNVPIVEVW